MQNALKLYLAWLIPCTFSFSCSLAILYYVTIAKPALRSQLFHQLTMMLVFANLIQSGNWFAGVKYSAPYTTCAIMEYLLQSGTLFTGFSTIVICGVALYVVRYRKQPSQKVVIRNSCLVMVIPSLAVVTSISLSSARLYCDVNIDKYSQASYREKVATLAYWLCFTLFVYGCAVADIIFLYVINLNLRELDRALSKNSSTSRSTSTTTGVTLGDRRRSQMSIFVNRLRWYPIIYVLCWLPDSLSLVAILVTGKSAVGFRIIANAAAGSTGWLMALAYFYYQLSADKASRDCSSPSAGRGDSSSTNTSSPMVLTTTSHSLHTSRSEEIAASDREDPPLPTKDEEEEASHTRASMSIES